MTPAEQARLDAAELAVARHEVTFGFRVVVLGDPMPSLDVHTWPIPEPLPRDPREPKKEQ